jgi:lipoprotein-anchoring transpeptidase ErfK/SrfK
VVSLPDRRLALLENGRVKKVYVVAVGRKSTPSPTGTFMIMNRVANPSYSHDGKVVAPGGRNPVGTRWMGLSVKGYGIHGTNAPKSIGKAASHGCIRMEQSDLEALFDEMETGDQVEIIGERDAETAEIFGGAEGTDASPAPAQTSAEEAAPVETAPAPIAVTSVAIAVAR